jgi:hypothetical protein
MILIGVKVSRRVNVIDWEINWGYGYPCQQVLKAKITIVLARKALELRGIQR